MVSVSTKVLIWARERAGYTQEQAAHKSGISLKNYQKIEYGEKEPTDKQIRTLSRVYGCPLIAFFLQTPPPESKVEADFRKHIDKNILPEERGYLRRLVTNIESRQLIVKSLREDDEDGHPSPVNLVGKIVDADSHSVGEVAKIIEKEIDFNLGDYRGKRT